MLGNEVRRLGVDPECVVAGKIAHREVVGVDMVARRDRRRREADDLIVFAHRRPRLDGFRRDLVPRRDVTARRDALAGDLGAGQDVRAGDDDVVGGIEADGEHRHGADLRAARAGR